MKAILKPFDIQRTKDINEFNDVIQTLANTFEEEDIDEEEGEDDNNEVFDMNLEPVTVNMVLDSKQVDTRLESYRGQRPFPKAKT